MDPQTTRVIIHAVIAAIGTIYFLLSYLKDKLTYQLLFVIWIPLTLLVYVSTNKVYLWVLGGIEFAFFAAVMYFLFRRQKTSMQEMQEELEQLGNDPADEPEDSDPDNEIEIDL